jgi:small-conductance mechanosensitive channel
MVDPDVTSQAVGFWEANREWLVAAGTVLLALATALGVDRAFQRRGRDMAEAVLRGQVSRETDTRLRFVRRLVSAAIVLAGVALALSQFAGISRIAASLLASGVVAAAVVGFAARQTLANFVAGVMLAITQPIRVGDWVTVEEHYGVVEDVRLNYSILRTPGGQRVVIPNELLTSSVLVNDTLTADAVGLDVAVWIPPGADAGHAVAVLREEEGIDATVAEAQPWGVRLAVGGDPVPPPERAGREAELRARCLARLQAEGLLEGFPPQARS